MSPTSITATVKCIERNVEGSRVYLLRRLLGSRSLLFARGVIIYLGSCLIVRHGIKFWYTSDIYPGCISHFCRFTTLKMLTAAKKSECAFCPMSHHFFY